MWRVDDVWIPTQNWVKFAFSRKNATNFCQSRVDRKQWNNIIMIFVNHTAIITVNNELVRGLKIIPITKNL